MRKYLFLIFLGIILSTFSCSYVGFDNHSMATYRFANVVNRDYIRKTYDTTFKWGMYQEDSNYLYIIDFNKLDTTPWVVVAGQMPYLFMPNGEKYTLSSPFPSEYIDSLDYKTQAKVDTSNKSLLGECCCLVSDSGPQNFSKNLFSPKRLLFKHFSFVEAPSVMQSNANQKHFVVQPSFPEDSPFIEFNQSTLQEFETAINDAYSLQFSASPISKIMLQDYKLLGYRSFNDKFYFLFYIPNLPAEMPSLVLMNASFELKSDSPIKLTFHKEDFIFSKPNIEDFNEFIFSSLVNSNPNSKDSVTFKMQIKGNLLMLYFHAMDSKNLKDYYHSLVFDLSIKSGNVAECHQTEDPVVIYFPDKSYWCRTNSEVESYQLFSSQEKPLTSVVPTGFYHFCGYLSQKDKPNDSKLYFASLVHNTLNLSSVSVQELIKAYPPTK